LSLYAVMTVLNSEPQHKKKRKREKVDIVGEIDRKKRKRSKKKGERPSIFGRPIGRSRKKIWRKKENEERSQQRGRAVTPSAIKA